MAKTYQVAHKAKFGSNANSNSDFDKITTQEKEKDGKKDEQYKHVISKSLHFKFKK